MVLQESFGEKLTNDNDTNNMMSYLVKRVTLSMESDTNLKSNTVEIIEMFQTD